MPNTSNWLYNTWNTGTSTQQQQLRVQYSGDTSLWTQWIGGSRDPIDLETKEQRIKRRWRENL